MGWILVIIPDEKTTTSAPFGSTMYTVMEYGMRCSCQEPNLSELFKLNFFFQGLEGVIM